MKMALLLSGLIFFISNVIAQTKYYTKTARIDFFSNAPLEDIEAKNNLVSALIDTNTGALQFSVLMKGFEFKKALMQEHFNENYVESDKHPKASFNGSILNNSEIDYKTPGNYTATVKGLLTIHGVTKEITTTGTLKIDNHQITAIATFHILVDDYKIKIPAAVKNNIAKTIRIQVNAILNPLK